MASLLEELTVFHPVSSSASSSLLETTAEFFGVQDGLTLFEALQLLLHVSALTAWNLNVDYDEGGDGYFGNGEGANAVGVRLSPEESRDCNEAVQRVRRRLHDMFISRLEAAADVTGAEQRRARRGSCEEVSASLRLWCGPWVNKAVSTMEPTKGAAMEPTRAAAVGQQQWGEERLAMDGATITSSTSTLTMTTTTQSFGCGNCDWSWSTIWMICCSGFRTSPEPRN